MDLCEQHGRVHRICSPVSFRREDGTAFVMNSYYSTTHLVVVVFGLTVRPGFGAPIRKEDPGPTPGTVGGDDDPGKAVGGDERYSPEWLADAIRQVMGGIDLDPASSAEANRIVKATRFYTRDANGLTSPWEGRIFLNPPFSTGLRPWVEKLAAEIQAGRVEQAFVIGPTDMLTHLGHQWFRVLISGSLLLPHKRIEFLDPTTGRWTGPRFGTFASYWGVEQHRFVRVFGEKGVILQPAEVPEHDRYEKASQESV